MNLQVLFWNASQAAAATELLAELAQDTDADVIVLAELSDPATALRNLNSATRSYYLIPTPPSRINFFVAMPPDRIEPVHDGKHLVARRIRPFLADDIIVVATHFPSKLRLGDDDQAALCTRIARTITEVETRLGHDRTILIGDLNMNPFEPGVVSSEGLHAVGTRAVASRGQRVVYGESRPFFYNPMWSLLGDLSVGPPGTFYYHSSAPVTYFWNVFDQVLLRPSLAARFESGDVRVIDRIGATPLLSAAGRLSAISDHLPIMVTVRLQEVDASAESMG